MLDGARLRGERLAGGEVEAAVLDRGEDVRVYRAWLVTNGDRGVWFWRRRGTMDVGLPKSIVHHALVGRRAEATGLVANGI
ncbi:hypothetical protein GCM10023238_11680 [Streptomyces heliomycini]